MPLIVHAKVLNASDSKTVVPLFKNDGERSDPGKYRPISLLPIIGKIFESFINYS